jgi:hypothetical protein
VSVPNQTREVVKAFASDVFVLYRKEVPIRNSLSAVFSTEDPVQMATHIRTILGLPEFGTTLEQLLASLDGINFPVIFANFETSLKEADIHAFTVSREDLRMIFVDRDCSWEDVSWRIYHELAHILAGHSAEVTAADEKFCNQVAIEILTPKAFFAAKKTVLKRMLASPSPVQLHSTVQDIADFLGASFMGVVLSLIHNRVVQRDSSVAKMLFKLAHQRKDSVPTIRSFVTDKGEDADGRFWLTALDDPSRKGLFKLEALARDALLEGALSVSKAAEIFSVDELIAEKLRNTWAARYAAAD